MAEYFSLELIDVLIELLKCFIIDFSLRECLVVNNLVTLILCHNLFC